MSPEIDIDPSTESQLIADFILALAPGGRTMDIAAARRAIQRFRDREPLAASSPPARPDGWLDGEIDLTAFALAHPDCDVRAVLRGFAEWILAAPKAHP